MIFKLKTSNTYTPAYMSTAKKHHKESKMQKLTQQAPVKTFNQTTIMYLTSNSKTLTLIPHLPLSLNQMPMVYLQLCVCVFSAKFRM